MHGFDVYRQYLAMKQHFSNEKFDYFQYDGKVKVNEKTYQNRADFWYFETVARKFNPKQMEQYMLATFVDSDNPSKVWIGDIKKNGPSNLANWQKRQQSLHYLVSQDLDKLVEYMEEHNLQFNDLFNPTKHHPPLLKLYLKKQIYTETMIVLDIVLGYMLQWDKKLRDPVWQSISFKIKKYKPFLSIEREKYKKLLLTKFN